MRSLTPRWGGDTDVLSDPRFQAGFQSAGGCARKHVAANGATLVLPVLKRPL